MKKLIVLLLFIPLVSFGQTFDDALKFMAIQNGANLKESYF
tara:strand:+ start:37 stop:159 length:123 start_codon:yes stop_codon:yes gene_type:complete